ncbi:MAG TPA: tyrosine-protein phosphatase [Gemmataceae bacterium]|jgi:protein tyrosine phosphatase (PTP) superfamily phosphohydrolase (DUF442 family)|nr:tyrosine-protein phosphatase [Gemmataceae bacterium]
MPGWLSRSRRAAAWTLRGLLLFGVVTIGFEVYRIYFASNWRTLLPGHVYRCAQLSHDEFVKRVREHGVRTVVNLRGCCTDFDWYQGEARATCDLDITQEDVTFSANRLPPPDELRQLVDVIDRAEYPLIVHCRQGVDRTGLAAGVILLLTTDTPLSEARGQLGLRYGHVAVGPTRAMTQFFDLYERWLTAQRMSHSRDTFRQWAVHEYCPGRCRGALEWLGPVRSSVAGICEAGHDSASRDPSDPRPASQRPATEMQVAAGRPTALHVRAQNLSPEVWRLLPGTGTGVHVRFLVFDESLTVVQVERAGLFVAEVSPGRYIDLTLAVAPLRPGKYRLVADLLDGPQWSFSQYGMEPLTLDLQVTSHE